MSKNVVLKDTFGNQIFPATTAEQVSYDGNKNMKQALDTVNAHATVANEAADMTDETKIYVYTGSETGYTFGHWYYHDGSAWTDGGVYMSGDTDTTLSLSGIAADAAVVGDEINNIHSAIDVNSAMNINAWTQGSLTASAGSATNSNTRCRSNGYFNSNNLGSGIAKISIANGLKLTVRIWDEKMNYLGYYPEEGAGWAETELQLPVTKGYSYRFVAAKTNDAAITPADLSSDEIKVINDGITDITLKMTGKAADAKTVEDVIFPYTSACNRTSAILAAKIFNYADGTKPVIDWYLLVDYAGDLYISKDLKNKYRISRFVNWTNYKFTIRQNGDIIAVYRNEFNSAGSSHDSSLDDIRQNPYVCLYSENYASWHEVDFGSRKKPSGWLQNCGLCVLPNGDIIFGEYTRMMVLYTSNLWRIKANADLTDPSSWEILKTYTVAQNDTITYDESVIEHFHTVQADPYTGTVYYMTGDKGKKSQIWYSKDNGDTWTQQSFVDPDTSAVITNGEKFFRLLNFNFTKDHVYWSSDSYSEHAVLQCERNGADGFVPNSIQVLATIEPTAAQIATYSTVFYQEYNIIVLLERLDGTASSMPFRVFDLADNTLKTVDTIKSSDGSAKHIGFRTEYTEFDPVDDVIKCGFGSNATYRNYNAICGNAGKQFEYNINNHWISIAMDSNRNVYATFGCYYI